jgi:hypothetical protein
MTVTCLTHGPMRRRESLCWWECVGFDGEGCGMQVVYDEDLARGTASGIPNVEVRP